MAALREARADAQKGTEPSERRKLPFHSLRGYELTKEEAAELAGRRAAASRSKTASQESSRRAAARAR